MCVIVSEAHHIVAGIQEKHAPEIGGSKMTSIDL